MRKKQYKSFEEARKFVHSLGLKSKNEWAKYCKSGKKLNEIPTSPERQYEEWNGWGDWLGTGTIASFDKKFRSFERAREFVRALGLKNEFDWQTYCKSGKKPDDIPHTPRHVYREKWKGTGDWLGTGRIAPQDRNFKSFTEAREFVRSLYLKNQKEWQYYCKSGNKPDDIPANPARTYPTEWKSYGDWLGTGRIAPQDRNFKSFTEAREFVRALGLKNQKDWLDYCKSGQKPDDIPSYPWEVYGRERKQNK